LEWQGLDIDAYIGLYSSFNNIIRTVAAEHHVTMIDLAREIPADSRYMYDSVHLTSHVSDRVAEIINPLLLDVLTANDKPKEDKVTSAARAPITSRP
jgi:hypothetical protein